MKPADIKFWYDLLCNGTSDDKIIARQILGLYYELY